MSDVPKPRVIKSTPVGRADKAMDRSLEGEDVDALLAALQPHERDIYFSIAKEIRDSGTSEELNQLWKVDYLQKPPSIVEFVEDDYWLGGVLRTTPENPGLFPTWKDKISNDFDLHSRIHNLVITGSLGIGKTYLSVTLILYRLALCSLLRNPQSFLGLSKGSRIVYVLMSVTRAVVADTAFGDAMNFMANSPYFLEKLHYNANISHGKQSINLSRGLYLQGGSKGQHILGRNTIGVQLDEGNWRLEAKPDLKAYKLFDEIRTRIKNRFQKTTGFLPAISIISSSAKDESSFTEQVITDIRKIGNPKLETVYSDAVYTIRSAEKWMELGVTEEIALKHANQYGTRYFRVSYGLRNIIPKVLGGWVTSKGLPIEGEPLEEVPPGCRVEIVPEELLESYKRNVYTALQSLSGISTGGSYLLFPSMVDFEACTQLGEKAGVVSPVKGGAEELSISEENSLEVWDYLDHRKFLQIQYGTVLPKRDPYALRFAHIDPATRSRCGIGICHVAGHSKVEGIIDTNNGKVYAEDRLIIEYDFKIVITAGAQKPISFEKVLKFFLWLQYECGFRFGLVTADTYQSFMSLQMLENRNVPTKVLSMDRSAEPHHIWRQCYEERRIRQYHCNEAYREAEKLIDGPKKVDHPAEGQKDLTDGMAGACYNAMTAKEYGNYGSTAFDPVHMSTGGIVPETEANPAPIQLSIPVHTRRPREFTA